MAARSRDHLGLAAFYGRLSWPEGEATRVDMTTMFGVLSGIGLLGLSTGAFGVLDAFQKRNLRAARVDWLIALFAFGVLLNVFAYTIYGRWYVAAPLVLMLLPADRAMRIRLELRRRRAEAETFER